ncbi:MAG: vitamin B12 transport system substrate-binding protein [Kangiellaceae bacterium]|jgi:vitamin B12 transport system substrate-binding protein
MDYILVTRKLTRPLKNTFLLISLRCFLTLSLLITWHTSARTTITEPTKQLRIVTLSPHLTEIVYALGKGPQLVAVSDYSDFPAAASTLRSVASYQGANIAEIIRLQPTHILVWRGGNKDADIEKLKALNMSVYESSINSVDTLLADIISIGDTIDASLEAKTIVKQLNESITAMSIDYKDLSKSVVYYLSTQPLVGLGNDKWLNSLLGLCGITNIYANSPSAYPQLQMADIIRKQPEVLIAGMNVDKKHSEQFWSPHKQVLNSDIAVANPDALHRFTPRAIIEMARLCKTVYPEISLR